MGFFSGMYTKEGPGVPKNAPKKKGIARFFEMWFRDAGMIWRVSMLTTLCFLPCLLALLIGVLFHEYGGMLLIAAAVFLAGSVLTGPALCALHAVIIKIVRDEPGYLMHIYKKAWKENLRQSIPGGMLLMVLLFTECGTGFYFLTHDTGSYHVVMIALAFFCLLVVMGCGLLMFVQMLFLELPFSTLLKNSLLLLFGYLKRTLPATMLLIVSLMLILLFPSVLIWVPAVLLGLPGLLVLWVDMLLWPVMEKAFSVSERQQAKRDAEEQEADGAAN